MRVGVLLAALAACAPGKPSGSCLFWEDCGEGGACEYSTPAPGGTVFECSFPDGSCPSGRAFGEFASEERRGTCVEFSSGFDGLCDPQDPMRGCATGLYCELGRCLSVRQLDATASLATALCADDGRNGGDVYVWGIAFVLGTTLFPPGLFADARPHVPPPEPLPDPPPPTTPQFEASSVTVGTTHLCLAGETADDGEPRSECFGRPNDPAVTTEPPVPGDWAQLTPPTTGPTGTVYDVVSGGKSHTCGTAGRDIACWGVNGQHQLDGVGVATDLATGVMRDVIAVGEAITHVSAGASFTCAGTTTDVWCWGDGEKWTEDTFDGAPRGTVLRVKDLTPGPVTSLDAGDTHACAVKGGVLWCWGGNGSGQSSGEASALPISPVQPLGDTPVLAVATGRQHTCAVTGERQVRCWGNNAQNQLGSPTTTTTPVVVPLFGRAVGTRVLAAGDDFTCALLEDSWIHCWGAPELTTAAVPALDRIPLCP